MRESEERFRAAVGAVSNLVWTNNARGMMEGEQPGWAAFTGQSFAEYQGYGWSNAVHADVALPTIEAWERAVARKSAFEFEHRLRRSDGEWRLCSIRAVPLKTATGEIREWVGVHTDVTDQKRADEALRDSEDRFRAIADNVPHLAWMTDGEGNFDWFNRRWVEYTGTTVGENQGAGWKLVHHPGYVDAVAERFERHIREGRDW